MVSDAPHRQQSAVGQASLDTEPDAFGSPLRSAVWAQDHGVALVEGSDGICSTSSGSGARHVSRDGRRNLWQFLDCLYWDDDGLDAEDIKALVLQRKRRLEQKVRSAHSLMRAEEDGRPTRVPIPTEMRRAVFERDGGRCVECDGRFDLQYDHILPVAHGGATTLQNLQLLCADCNRRKSDSV